MTTDPQTDRRAQYKAAIRKAGDSAYGNRPFYEAITEAAMAVADAEQAELRRERDLAIAHDRQPYPTAWAYEQACKALHRKEEAIARVLEFAASLDETGRQLAGPDAVHPVAAHIRHLLDTQPADGASRGADEEQQPETKPPHPPETFWQIETQWHTGDWRSWALRTEHDEALREFEGVKDGKHAWRLVRFHTTTAIEAEHAPAAVAQPGKEA